MHEQHIDEPNNVSLSSAAVVWWASLWRCVIMAMALGVVCGVVGFFIPAVAPVIELIKLFSFLPISVYVMSRVMNRRYKRFTVSLMDRHTGAPIPQNYWQAGIPLYWSQLWRSLFVSALFSMIVLFFGGAALIVERLEPQECQEYLDAYLKHKAIPSEAALANDAAAHFHRLDCDAKLSPTPEQKKKQQEIHERALGGLMLGLMIAAPITLLLQWKIMQIILRKKYREFYVKVTQHFPTQFTSTPGSEVSA